MALHSAAKGKLISVIGDEDTCVGFLLGGVGEINKNRHPNFMVVDKNTAVSEIEDCVTNRPCSLPVSLNFCSPNNKISFAQRFSDHLVLRKDTERQLD